MPKHTGNFTKAERMVYVWEALKELGRGSPESILRKVAYNMGLDAEDGNLKRSIYRDLKSLTSNGEIDVDYFTPSGEKLLPGDEENYKNLRIEYFLRRSESNILGGDLLDNSQMRFIPQSAQVIQWRVSEIATSTPKDSVGFVFKNAENSHLVLYSPINDLPLTLIFARNPKNADLIPDQERLLNEFGPRASLLLLNESTISRPSKEGKFGHACIKINGKGDKATIIDMGSLSGTFTKALSPEDVHEINSKVQEDLTLPFNSSPIYRVSPGELNRISEDGAELSLPFILALGQCHILVQSFSS